MPPAINAGTLSVLVSKVSLPSAAFLEGNILNLFGPGRKLKSLLALQKSGGFKPLGAPAVLPADPSRADAYENL
jgi:hypothetical protein